MPCTVFFYKLIWFASSDKANNCGEIYLLTVGLLWSMVATWYEPKGLKSLGYISMRQ